MCDAPPLSQIMIADFATFRRSVGAAATRPARSKPK
jgi:hypothetical protein